MSAESPIMPRLITPLILSVLAVSIWLAILRPAFDWKARTFAELTTSQSERARLNASLSRLESERAQLSGDTSLAIIWKAKRLGAATALIQSEISKIAKKTGVSIRTITPVPSKDIPFSHAIGFRIEGEATLDNLTAFIIALEVNTPALVIEQAALRRLARPGRTAAQPGVFVRLNLIAPVALDEEEEA